MLKNFYSKDEYDVIEMDFKNSTDFVEYLKKAETSLVFSNKPLASQNTDKEYRDWCNTKSFDEALNLFENGWTDEFSNFLQIKKQIDKYFPYVLQKRIYKNNFYGSVPNVSNVVRNLPLTMRKVCMDQTPKKHIIVNFNAACPWFEKKEQMLRNGVLTLSLMDFFESLGYRVDFNFYLIAENGNQRLNIIIKLKEAGTKMNLQKIYFPFCNSSFLRRLCFRVIETIPELGMYWIHGYGNCIRQAEVKNILGINSNNIYIGWPDEMGIKGKNIDDDISEFIKRLSLNDYMNYDLKKYSINDDKHVLKLKK